MRRGMLREIKRQMLKRNKLGLYLIVLTALSCKVAQEQTTVNNGNNIQITTNCGVVQGDSVSSTVSSEDGIPIRVQTVSGTNQVIYYEENDPEATLRLLKLQGISGAETGESNFAIQFLEENTGGRLYLFLADDDCEAVVDGGGIANVGTLVNSAGISINEELIRSGFVAVEQSDLCKIEQISSCLNALKESSPITAGELDELLWKPNSDSDGRLAVHSGPSNTTVIVNGEVGMNQGGGNGYGSLARFSQSGCNYGSARVQVIDGNSGLPYSVNGSATLVIPNGCQRTCLSGGVLAACSK